MLDKLEDLKRQSEQSNERLREMVVTELSEDGIVALKINGHRELKEIILDDAYTNYSKEDLEDLIYTSFNKALEKVNKANEAEVMNSAKSLFPGF